MNSLILNIAQKKINVKALRKRAIAFFLSIMFVINSAFSSFAAPFLPTLIGAAGFTSPWAAVVAAALPALGFIASKNGAEISQACIDVTEAIADDLKDIFGTDRCPITITNLFGDLFRQGNYLADTVETVVPGDSVSNASVSTGTDTAPLADDPATGTYVPSSVYKYIFDSAKAHELFVSGYNLDYTGFIGDSWVNRWHGSLNSIYVNRGYGLNDWNTLYNELYKIAPWVINSLSQVVDISTFTDYTYNGNGYVGFSSFAYDYGTYYKVWLTHASSALIGQRAVDSFYFTGPLYTGPFVIFDDQHVTNWSFHVNKSTGEVTNFSTKDSVTASLIGDDYVYCIPPALGIPIDNGYTPRVAVPAQDLFDLSLEDFLDRIKDIVGDLPSITLPSSIAIDVDVPLKGILDDVLGFDEVIDNALAAAIAAAAARHVVGSVPITGERAITDNRVIDQSAVYNYDQSVTNEYINTFNTIFVRDNGDFDIDQSNAIKQFYSVFGQLHDLYNHFLPAPVATLIWVFVTILIAFYVVRWVINR